jgi:molybdopterin-containing oxidoreductase family membrane subunit
LLEWADLSIPLWYGVGPEISLINTVLFGQFWYVLWVFNILLGVAIPVVLLVLMPRRTAVVGMAGALVAIAYMGVRLNIVIPGLITPELAGLESAYIESRLSFSYFPSLFEWQLLLFVVTIGIALFYMGYRLLPLTWTEEKVV